MRRVRTRPVTRVAYSGTATEKDFLKCNQPLVALWTLQLHWLSCPGGGTVLSSPPTKPNPQQWDSTTHHLVTEVKEFSLSMMSQTTQEVKCVCSKAGSTNIFHTTCVFSDIKNPANNDIVKRLLFLLFIWILQQQFSTQKCVRQRQELGKQTDLPNRVQHEPPGEAKPLQ